MIRKIALLDWDGTIRKDFTIRTWIKFLVSQKKLSEKAFEDMEEVFDLLFKKSITHDETACRIASLYAYYLRGQSKAEITKMASLFFEEDTRYLCSFSSALFSFLSNSGLQIMVISGAPIEILHEYQRRFPINTIHALELQSINEVYTGKIQANSGTAQEKKLIIEHLMNSKMYQVTLAAGNSSSDLPLLDVAPVALVVNNQSLKTPNKCFYLSCESTDVDMMLAYLKREVGSVIF